jgi:hypothetical protein
LASPAAFELVTVSLSWLVSSFYLFQVSDKTFSPEFLIEDAALFIPKVVVIKARGRHISTIKGAQ